ncbi:MAG: MFS transporter [Burkholderiaceae bacterium]|nr:MFS transporter [Burkholderiaceae bacterium]
MEAVAEIKMQTSLFAPQWRSLSIGAVALCSMIAFEAIGVAAGMPAVATALDGLSLYALAFGGTLAGSVVSMVWSGQDCDRHGPFRSMAGGIALFALGLLVAGLAPSMAALIASRIVQGLGVGALGVALYVSTARALPSALHPRLFALFSTAWVVPAIVGPAISGWIVEYWGWRWLFLGVALLLLPVALLILPTLRETGQSAPGPQRSWRTLPWALLASISSVGLATAGYAGGWTVPVVFLALAAAVISAARLLPHGTLTLARGLSTVIAMRGLNSAAFFLCEGFVPLWLHQQAGWSITAAGLALTGGALCWSLGSQLQSRVSEESRRMSWLSRGSLPIGTGILLCVLSVLGWIPAITVLIGWSLAGLGMGMSFPILGVLTLKLAPREQQGRYSSAMQLCSALGTSGALALGGLMFSLLQADRPVLAYSSVYLLAALFALVSWRSAARVGMGNPPRPSQ